MSKKHEDNIDDAIADPVVGESQLETALAAIPASMSTDEAEYVEAIGRLEDDFDALAGALVQIRKAPHDQERVAGICEYIERLHEYVGHVNTVVILRHNLFGELQ